jgi:DNA-binding MurR/RpiR family transcriptional regulator
LVGVEGDIRLGEAEVVGAVRVAAAPGDDPDAARAEALWQSKTDATRETRGLARGAALAEAARWLAGAEMLFVAGDGIDGEAARSFAGRIALLGHRAVAHNQPHDLLASLSAATPRDLLLVICGHGGNEWMRACREMRTAGGNVLVLARKPGRLASAANACLAVSAHDPQPHVEDLLYEAAMRHLLDDLFLRIVAARPAALETFAANRRRLLATGD